MGAIANLFGYVLNFLYNWLQNYGFAIILFTALLKVIMLPISIKQQKAMKKSQKLQDEINKINLKFKNNPEMIQRETLELYKREKVSPFSGCLSSILQLVIFISVFYLVSRPLTYMKKADTSLINSYEQIVTEQNNNQKLNYPEIAIIEYVNKMDLSDGQDDLDKKKNEYEQLHLNMNFFGLDLSMVPSQNYKDIKVFIIPALYVVITFVNIKITNNMTGNKKKKAEDSVKELAEKNSASDDDKKSTSNNDESMQDSLNQMTRSMNYTIPIMSIAIAIIAPLGLSLYWLVSNVLQLLERFILTRGDKE